MSASLSARIHSAAAALARRIAAWTVEHASPKNRVWVRAMNAELDLIDGGFARLRWATSGLRMASLRAPNSSPMSASITGRGGSMGAGNREWVGPVGRNAIAVLGLWLSLVGARVIVPASDDWVASYLVLAVAVSVAWMVAIGLQAGFMAYFLAGQVAYGVVSLSAHLVFGIEKVQGGPVNLSIMIAGTLATVFAGALSRGSRVPVRSPVWDPRDLTQSAIRGAQLLARRTELGAYAAAAAVAVAVPEAWLFLLAGTRAFRDVESHFAVVAAGVAGLALGAITERSFGGAVNPGCAIVTS